MLGGFLAEKAVFFRAQIANFFIHFFPKSQQKTGDRCYDFLNILAKKIGDKIGVFDSKQG
jgi:hypothetical protein